MAGVNPKTLGTGNEGGYTQPNYAYIQQHDYDFEELCEFIRQALKYGDAGTWDAAMWSSKTAKKFPEGDGFTMIAKETRQAVKWVKSLVEVWDRFSKIRETGQYDDLYFSHYLVVMEIRDDAKAQEWLDKASDNSWSSRMLYRKITEGGEFSHSRYTALEKMTGYLEHTPEGFKVFDDAKDKTKYTIVEDKLDELIGKKVKIIISVQQKGTTKDRRVEEDAPTAPTTSAKKGAYPGFPKKEQGRK